MAIDESATTEEQRRLAELRERASAELERIETTEALEDWRTRYLGRERGELSAILKGLGKLPGEQRKAHRAGGERGQDRAGGTTGGAAAGAGRARADGGAGARDAWT